MIHASYISRKYLFDPPRKESCQRVTLHAKLPLYTLGEKVLKQKSLFCLIIIIVVNFLCYVVIINS